MINTLHVAYSNRAGAGQLAPLLAQAIKELGARRPADAIGPLPEAARIQPSNLTIQHDLGLACL